jgi:hypothetical protein
MYTFSFRLVSGPTQQQPLSLILRTTPSVPLLLLNKNIVIQSYSLPSSPECIAVANSRKDSQRRDSKAAQLVQPPLLTLIRSLPSGRLAI